MSKLSDIGTIRALLTRHGFHFSKSLGQNFLINPSVCPRMADMCGAASGVGVLEIGPGIGVLTVELAKRADKVVAIELDDRLLPVLAETLADHPNAAVIRGDALKLNLNQIISDEFAGMEVVVCANLPYYITSPMIMKLLEDRLPVSAITVMVQKEAADRICAQPGTREAGALSLGIAYYAEPEILFRVSRGSFMPAPNVDSAVIRLRVRPPEIAPRSEAQFFSIIKAAFAQRRKTLLNALAAGTGRTKAEWTTAFEAAGVSPSARAEELTLAQFAALSDALPTE